MKMHSLTDYISEFFGTYLRDEIGASINTILSYRDAFLQLIDFLETKEKKKIGVLTIDVIKRETIVEFLEWIEKERKCSFSTRNSRLAAIRSFYNFLGYKPLDNMAESLRIKSIRAKKGQ